MNAIALPRPIMAFRRTRFYGRWHARLQRWRRAWFYATGRWSRDDDPQRIRETLASFVQIASGAANERDRRMIAVVVPQMVRALPDDEAAKWLAVFGFEPLNSEQKGD